MKQRYTIYALFLLSLFVSISASAQIKGVITDSLTNEPLMYITVQYEGKGVGGISNANGEYQVETRKGWDELTFSAVGYITKKVKLKPGTRVLNVKLQSDDIMLSEVVVKPKKEKYSRKNNPAVEFMKKVIENKKAMDENPDAVAVLVNNPTYYGICSDLRTIVKKAHARGMKVLADEAHGTHLYFGRNLPVSGMAAGADMAAVSMHKSGGSLTQSSLLLLNKSMNAEKVRQIINLTQTTSASYLLLSSLDISRRNLALRGEESFEKVAGMAQYAREEINEIGGYYAYGMDLINGTSVFDFDVTKLSIYTLGNGLAGIEVYDLLRDEYDIQIEFGDICNILAYISIGDRLQDIERLVGALADIERLYKKDSTGMLSGEYIAPAVVASPQQAFYAEKESLPMEQAAGRISGEFVMCYPPGIPILAPGEMVTQEIVEYILYARDKGCSMQGMEDPKVEHLQVLKGGI